MYTQDLRARLESAEITLVQISSYRMEKEQHDSKLKEYEKTIEEQKKQMFDALEHQERYAGVCVVWTVIESAWIGNSSKTKQRC